MINIHKVKNTLFFKAFITFLFVATLSACSSSPDDNPLWMPAAYSTEHNGTRVKISINSLDGVADILQANVMIQRMDGSGPSFEVQNASVEQKDDTLTFDWVDGFNNKGHAILLKVSEDEQTVQLKLVVDEVINERNMMFIDEYTLLKIPAGPNEIIPNEATKEE